MKHNPTIYLLGAAGLVIAVWAFGWSPAYLLVLLACPVMMFLMMRGMGSMRGEDHTGHGCEHDPTRSTEPEEPAPRGDDPSARKG